MNKVDAVAKDDEDDTATGNDSAMVAVTDVPSMIKLVKTADPKQVGETGDNPSVYRDVDYTFEFTNTSTVDAVKFYKLDDVLLDDSLNPVGTATDITADCDVNGTNLAKGIWLSAGDSASCVITMQLRGDAGDNHINLATVYGIDDDQVEREASDNETVTFTPIAPSSSMKFASSKLVVLRITNTGIENVTLTKILVKNGNVTHLRSAPGFNVLNTAGGVHETVGYSACTTGHELGYSGSTTDTYECAFTLELLPGIESAADIELSALDGEAVIVVVEDNEGVEHSNDVHLEVSTLNNSN